MEQFQAFLEQFHTSGAADAYRFLGCHAQERGGESAGRGRETGEVAGVREESEERGEGDERQLRGNQRGGVAQTLLALAHCAQQRRNGRAVAEVGRAEKVLRERRSLQGGQAEGEGNGLGEQDREAIGGDGGEWCVAG